jgi:putative transposon-encoded protein
VRCKRTTIRVTPRFPIKSTEREEPSSVAEGKKLRRNPPSNAAEDRPEAANTDLPKTVNGSHAKIEIFGEEMIEKRVKASANSGRVYLPPEWVGHKVKIIRID